MLLTTQAVGVGKSVRITFPLSAGLNVLVDCGCFERVEGGGVCWQAQPLASQSGEVMLGRVQTPFMKHSWELVPCDLPQERSTARHPLEPSAWPHPESLEGQMQPASQTPPQDKSRGHRSPLSLLSAPCTFLGP